MELGSFELEGKQVRLFGNPHAEYWIVQPVGQQDQAHLAQEYAEIKRLVPDCPFFFIAVQIDDWNRELPPWQSDSVFGWQSFGGDGAETLRFLKKQLLPQLYLGFAIAEPKEYLLAGYSLAGLFALWAACDTDMFSGIAAVSPSVWYPGWLRFADESWPETDCIYLSLGEAEERTKNETLAAVGNAIREQYRLLMMKNIPCTLEWNPGNHFRDTELRTARGIAWMLKTLTEKDAF